MKKIFFTVIALITLTLPAVAQDTVRALGPLPRYYCPGWFYDDDTVNWGRVGFGESQTDLASGFVVDKDDTLTVYGIAAILVLLPDVAPQWQIDYEAQFYEDTSREANDEYLRLYYATGGASLSRHPEQLHVNMKHTPISYYLLIEKVAAHGITRDSMPPFPVYERYFRQPVQVTDTFYVGVSNKSYRYTEPPYTYTTWGVDIVAFGVSHDINPLALGAYNDSITGWHFNNRVRYYKFMYPILTPPDTSYVWDTIATAADTTMQASDTVVAGDTLIVCDTVVVSDTLIVGYDTIVRYDTIVNYDTLLALPEHGLLGSLVGVMPNPAAETAKVVSSFGLTMVEAFNMAGEKVHTLRLPDAPLTATLDVRRWPSGTYLLRIHTPQGTAVKKLVVRK